MTAIEPCRGEKPASSAHASRLRRVAQFLRPLFVVALFIVALRVLASILVTYHWRDSVHYLSTLTTIQIVTAIVLAAAGYLVMTAYDTFAFRYINRTLIGGLVSNVPGGLGVFEAIALMLLVPYLPVAEVFGVLVAFRGIYFLLPLIVALMLLASHAVTTRKRGP